MNTKIKLIFDRIPRRQILSNAFAVQRSLGYRPGSITRKDSSEFVTTADIEIQNLLLAYFEHSDLAGSYRVQAEERVSSCNSNECGPLQLVIDPLDGTDEFIRGEPLWGTMVGVCDKQGILQYSWNLLSDGTLYSSDDDVIQAPRTWESDSSRELVIDLFDYGAGVVEQAAARLGTRFRRASQACAVWTGWRLLQGKLDGLLWLPSSLGKRFYPDYDLIFLGALEKQGYKIALGRQYSTEQNIALVAVTPCEHSLLLLWQVGLSLLPLEQRSTIRREECLRITTPIRGVSQKGTI